MSEGVRIDMHRDGAVHVEDVGDFVDDVFGQDVGDQPQHEQWVTVGVADQRRQRLQRCGIGPMRVVDDDHRAGQAGEDLVSDDDRVGRRHRCMQQLFGDRPLPVRLPLGAGRTENRPAGQ